MAAAKTDPLPAAADAYRAGDLDRAERLLGMALRRSRKDPDALYLRGLVAHRRGQPEEALSWMDRAVAADAEHAVAWSNRGRVLRALDRPEEAAESLERALALRPDLAEAWLELGHARLDREDLSAAEAACQEALRLRPDWTAALEGLGRALLEADRATEAEAVFRRQLALDPGAAAAHANLGIALKDQERLAEAEGALRRALALAPDLAGAHGALGEVCAARDDVAGAESAWRRAWALDSTRAAVAHQLGTLLCAGDRVAEGLTWHRRAVASAPDVHSLWIGFADAVGRFERVPEDLGPEIAVCFDREGVDHQLLERATRQLLEWARSEGTLPDQPLLRPLLEQTIVRHPDWEADLRALRRDLLDAAVEGRAVDGSLVAAVATQCDHTEFAWWEDDDETGFLASLDPNAPAVAMYRPRPAPPDPEPIPVLAMTEDATSAAVRDQYEESPYPRLVGLHRKPPAPLHAVVRSLFPHFDRAPRPEGPLRVLVAGCGTGQQAIAAATRYTDAEVLAVDLSRTSLSFARRRARALGIDNLSFAQADILALDQLEEQFHLVEAGGVAPSSAA
jgi:tetratricopeptide (TPR) repeat protein